MANGEPKDADASYGDELGLIGRNGAWVAPHSHFERRNACCDDQKASCERRETPFVVRNARYVAPNALRERRETPFVVRNARYVVPNALRERRETPFVVRNARYVVRNTLGGHTRRKAGACGGREVHGQEETPKRRGELAGARAGAPPRDDRRAGPHGQAASRNPSHVAVPVDAARRRRRQRARARARPDVSVNVNGQT
jgi:hypothetical protein